MRVSGLGRVAAAWWIAIAADVIQFLFLPLFAGGPAYAATDAIDIIVGLLLVKLLGWHWALLPTFVTEMVPLVDLVPTWTAAVWIVTRKRRGDPRRPPVPPASFSPPPVAPAPPGAPAP